MEYYAFSENFCKENDLEIYEKRALCYVFDDKTFKDFSDTNNPQGIIAVCKKKQFDIKNLLNLREDPILAIPQFEGRSAYYYVRKSYIEELVKADGLSIEYPDKENYPTFLQVTATLPKLELPKQKVLTDN